jgi:hypothetical protein
MVRNAPEKTNVIEISIDHMSLFSHYLDKAARIAALRTCQTGPRFGWQRLNLGGRSRFHFLSVNGVRFYSLVHGAETQSS